MKNLRKELSIKNLFIALICISFSSCKNENIASQNSEKILQASESNPVSDNVKSSKVNSFSPSELPKNLLLGEGEGLSSVIEYSYENHQGAWSPETLVLRNQEDFKNYLTDNKGQSSCWYFGDSYNPNKTVPQWAIIEIKKTISINYLGVLSSEYYSSESYSDRHVKDSEIWVSSTDKNQDSFKKILPITLHKDKFYEVFRIEPQENVKYIKYKINSNYGHKTETAIAPLAAFYDETPNKTTQEKITSGKADFYSIFFGLNSDFVRSESNPVLAQIKDYLTTNPTKNIEILVHNDKLENEKANQELTQKRADALKAKLKDLGIDEKRITAKGMAATKPVASNENEYDRSKNRRVEIIFK
ncbi:OmpA family protein [Bernardetia sp. MNP-M8]|uniref:OmpA family protein n=1 Tax=Bernardetia sp. MNP-M8 TaxID=3127470 RepID=UPI0030D02D7B